MVKVLALRTPLGFHMGGCIWDFGLRQTHEKRTWQRKLAAQNTVRTWSALKTQHLLAHSPPPYSDSTVLQPHSPVQPSAVEVCHNLIGISMVETLGICNSFIGSRLLWEWRYLFAHRRSRLSSWSCSNLKHRGLEEWVWDWWLLYSESQYLVVDREHFKAWEAGCEGRTEGRVGVILILQSVYVKYTKSVSCKEVIQKEHARLLQVLKSLGIRGPEEKTFESKQTKGRWAVLYISPSRSS